MNFDYFFKIIVIGDSGIGKSCLINNWIEGVWDPHYYNTIGVDFKAKTIRHGQELLKVQIFDAAGQERFRSVRSAFYRYAHAAIIVYDITNHKSFDDVNYWIEELLKYKEDKIPKFLVGTKLDLEEKREVTKEEGKELSEKIGAQFIEISSRKSLNINELFDQILNKFYELLNDKEFKAEVMPFKLPLEEKSQKKSCCK